MGLIGDGTTSALVGLDGSVPWLCLPRFDSEPLLCGLLGHAAGGRFTLTPVLEGWSRDLVPLEEYDAGSNGPPRRSAAYTG